MDRQKIEKGIGDFITRETTMQKIKRAGLPVPPKPEDAVNGTDLFQEWESVRKKYGSISNIPYRELGEFLDRWSAMVSYSRWCEAIADIDRATAEEIRDTVKKQLYIIQEGSREMKDASVYKEEIFLNWQIKHGENSAMYTMVRALREGYESRLNAISREITRRGSDFEDTRRSINKGVQA